VPGNQPERNHAEVCVNKSQLIDTIAERLELGRRQAVETVEAVFETIQQAVVNGERVVISGFGVFEKVQRAARLGRNPATGEPVPVQETVVPKFRPGSEFKAYVSGAKEMAQTAVQSARDSVQSAREAVERTVQAAADQISWPMGGEDGAESPDGAAGAAGGAGGAAGATAAAKPAAKPASAPRASTHAPASKTTTRSTPAKTGTTRGTTRRSGTAAKRTGAAGEKATPRRTSTAGGGAKPATSARATGTRATGTRSGGAAKTTESSKSNDSKPDTGHDASNDGSSSSG
jgi:DNA-binding protein HU-beta